MEKMPKIFIISLINSQRREFISKRLSDLKLDFEFFDAVYGKDLTEDQLEKIDFDFYPHKFAAKKTLTLGEIGCAMSHIKLYEYIVENNINSAIILEDDAIVSLYFKDIVSDALNKISPKYEILFLDHGKAKIYPFPKNLVERYRLARYVRPSKYSKRTIIRTTGYIITQNGARRLLQYAYPIRMPSDFLTGALQLTGIRAYGVEPSCVFGGSHSEINEMEDRYN